MKTAACTVFMSVLFGQRLSELRNLQFAAHALLNFNLEHRFGASLFDEPFMCRSPHSFVFLGGLSTASARRLLFALRRPKLNTMELLR